MVKMRTIYFYSKTIIILLLNLLCIENHSQNLYTNQIVVPPSPSVASFQHFDFSQINHYSGLPEITIPVYNLEIGSFKLPINLYYNYNGFKVENMAGWLGLGWDINAGGMISKIIRGKRDDDPNHGYYQVNEILQVPDPINNVNDFINYMDTLPKDILRYFANGFYDGIPDYYELKANNLSGSIIRLNSGDYVTIPYKKLDISRTYNFPSSNDYWEVVDESGNKYIFGHFTEDATQYGLENTSYEYSNNGNCDSDNQNYVSNWFLREIIINSNDTIRFNYTSETIYREPLEHRTRFRLLPTVQQCQPITDLIGTTTFYSTQTWKLSSIESRKCTIFFHSDTLRKDIIPNSNSCRLDYIEIKDFSDSTVKKMVFDYEYLGDDLIYDKCRLILSGISSFGSNGPSERYIFDYDNSTSVPSYTSKAQDFWGYYNGKINNSLLIPSVVPNSVYDDYFEGCADRYPNTAFSKLGLLKSITLPTKGSISYIYEPNDYGYIRNQPNDSVLIPIGSHNDHVSADGIANNYDIQTHRLDIDGEQTVKFSYLLDDNNNPHEYPSEVSIYSFSEVYFSKTGYNSEGSDEVTLSSGIYIIKATAYGTGLHAEITVTSRTHKKDELGNLIYSKNLTSGGYRIKQSVQYNGLSHDNDIILNYSYYMPDEPDRSCGVLHYPISYDYLTIQERIKYLGGSFNPPASDGDCQYITRSSSSILPTYGRDGYMGYAYITVKEGENTNNGSVLYNYYTSLEYPDKTFSKLTQSISKDYLRGRLKRMVVKDSSSVVLTKEYSYNNPYSSPNRSGIWGMFLVEYLHNDPQDYLDTFIYPFFDAVKSEWSFLTGLIETKYLSNGIVTDTISYSYENSDHAQITKIVKMNSDGKSMEEKYYYPSDNPTNIQTNNQTITQMSNKNLQFVLKNEKSINGTVVEGQVINYGINFFPSSVYKLEDGTYNPQYHFDSYDNYGNLLQLHKEDDLNVSYIWGYNNIYPVIKADNIDITTLTTAVTSIQSNLDGFLINTIGDNTSDVQKNAWKSFNASLRDALPSTTLITTFTYKPLIGMTSQTDPNDVTTYYEYDSFGRLSCIKDDDGRILKTYEYHYKQ